VYARTIVGWHALAIRAQRRPHGVRETPSTRAICLIGMPSARCSRRISAQSSTDNTSVPPRLGLSQGLGRGSVIEWANCQFSGVVDTLGGYGAIAM
jgi:hypothetical protein